VRGTFIIILLVRIEQMSDLSSGKDSLIEESEIAYEAAAPEV
jgi:hypothetical protein